jgi:hypothetical protein
MVSLVNSRNSTANTTAIQRLARAIALSQGQFSLLLLCCNSVTRQQQILSLLKEFSAADIKELVVPASAETLYTVISNKLDSIKPEALMVRGLESVDQINQLIISTNLMRDEFPKQFDFPLMLWVNDEILRKLVWLAPDLKDWAASTIRFDVPDYHFHNSSNHIAPVPSYSSKSHRH